MNNEPMRPLFCHPDPNEEYASYHGDRTAGGRSAFADPPSAPTETGSNGNPTVQPEVSNLKTAAATRRPLTESLR